MIEHNDHIPELLKRKLLLLGIDLEKAPKTIYAAIFSYNSRNNEYELLCLGSGSKCLPDTSLSPDLQDCLVHDMHAEVVCRRSFISFIYNQIFDIIINHNSSQYLLFDETQTKYSWNPELKLIFYTSQSPCGDCSIFKYIAIYSSEGKKRRIVDNDFLAAGRETDRIGILRTKPGRFDSPFSSSMSCSDKLCLWNILGLQGALLSHFVKPIYLDFVIIGDDFDLESSTRALVKRLSNFKFDEYFISKGFKNSTKTIIVQQAKGISLKMGSPADSSLFWFKGRPKTCSIILGFKKGSRRPKSDEPFGLSLQSPLSRQFIFEKLHKVLRPESRESYFEEKISSSDYQRAKKELFSYEVFKGWIVRNDRIKIFRDSLQ